MAAMIWIFLGVVAGLIILWALLRKSVAGIPLALGTAFLYVVAYSAVAWYPPSVGQTLLLTFLAGVSIALIAWGLANIAAERLVKKKFYVEKTAGESKLMAIKAEGNPYGVIVGGAPWSVEGAALFSEFLNETIWRKGYKVTHLCVEAVEIGGGIYAYVLGIIQPKTVIDRILY